LSAENRPSCERSAVSCDPNLYPPYARAKVCGQCGAEFLCGPTEDNGDCWCDRLPNVMPLLSPEAGCLCKNCLQAAINARLAQSAP